MNLKMTETIGGYSITSVPEQLPILELAVKGSAHPPAAWVTEQVTTQAIPFAQRCL